MRGARGWVLLWCLVAAQAAPAWAQVAADEAALAEAKRHFARGSALYKSGAADDALAEFERAYALSQAPGLWFNMGQAARASRRWDLATYYFRAYLHAVPEAPERAYVEGQLAQMAPLVTGVPVAEPESPEVPRQPVAVAPEAAPRQPEAAVAAGSMHDDRPGRGLRIAGIGVAGAGVALGATAVWFGMRAGDAADDVTRAHREGAAYDAALAERYRVGRRDEKVAIITGVGGATLVAGGALMWYLGFREGRRGELSVAPASGPGRGVAVGWSCAF